MVLRKKTLFTGILLLFFNLSYSNENNYWQNLIQTAFSNSESINSIKLEYTTALINKKQFDYQWFPQLQVTLQGTSRLTRGDKINILNESADPSLTQILSPFVNFSIFQRLPGQGTLSLSGKYGFNYLPERNSFLQWPELSFSFSQYLGRGIFGITGNPEYNLMNEQFFYSQMMYKRNLNSQIRQVLSLVQRMDLLCAEEDYYNALVKEYESELKTAQKKEASGMQSTLEYHYANHQFTEASNALTELQYEKKQLAIQLGLILPDFNQDELKIQRYNLQNIINNLYKDSHIQKESLKNNVDNIIYKNILQQYLYNYQNKEINYAPSLVISTAISPDENIYGFFSDWSKSFRMLLETPYPINFSVSIGIQKNFELPGAKKLRKEIYELNRNAIENEIIVMQKTQEKELEIIQEQIKSDISYISSLENQLSEEKSYREKRKKLLIENVITQDEFYQSETTFFKIYKDYLKSFWNVINNQIIIIDLCSETYPLLNEFIGDNYEL